MHKELSTNQTNTPPGYSDFGLLFILRAQKGGTRGILQLYIGHGNEIFWRTMYDGRWAGWKRLTSTAV